MSSLKEQVNKTAMLLNDIKVALEDQGVDTSNMTPKDYANAIRGVVNNITIDNISLIPVLIFKYSENRPDRPDGGSWNPETGETLVPEGWYTDIGLDYNAANKSLTLWMSNAVFSSNGDLYKKWSTPIRISGRDGQDGKQGPEGLPGTVAGVTQFFNYPIFYRGTSDQPDTPWAEYDPIENELQIQNGWTETIERTDNAGVVYWQSYVKYNTANMPPATCTTPIRMTAESSAVTGNIRYYQLSTSRSTPAKGTSSWKKWTEEIDIAPTKTQPYLFCYDETIYGESRKTTSPVYLMATYTLGLLDIDITYAVGQENTVKKRDGESDSEYNERFGKFWFTDSVEAISADKDKEKHPDDEDFNYYPGLTERTTYLWCRETFEYNDHVEQFYRVISYYKAAEKAPVLYSAGVYSDLVHYTRNDEQCPYVFYPNGLYLDESETVITKTEDGKDVPVTDNDSPTDGKKYQYFFLKNSYENNEVFDSFYEAYLNKKWKKIDSFEAIYSDIGIFKSAQVGKFVFDDKYMFSMFGKGFIDNNSSGTIKMEYTNFTDTKGKIWDDSEGKWKTREGVATAIDAAVHGAEADKKFIPGTLINAVTGESWFANGNTRFYYDGEGDLAGGAIAWRYDNDESEKPTLYIDGDVKIGTRANDHVYDTSVAISDAKSFNEVVSEQDTIKKMISQVQDQIDGVVENYFEEGAPTTKNKPVTDWIAASDDDDYELINHVGDTYTNIQEYVNDEKTPDAGKSWRWCWCQDDSITDKIKVIDKEGDERYLHWHPIADSDAVKALQEAAKAQTTADGKARTFVTTPTPPYSEGDLWVQGSSGDIKRCKEGVKKEKSTDVFDVNDWENASKYTDDTKANAAKKTADDALAKANAVETKMSDVDQLTAMFGTVSDNSGATLAKYIGVKDSNNKIIGALNGSDLGKDSKNGKLILATGMNGIDNMSSATTRIYENGKLITTDANITGTITATGFKVDFANLNSDYGSSTGYERNWLFVDDGFLKITRYNSGFTQTWLDYKGLYFKGGGLGDSQGEVGEYGFYTSKNVGSGAYSYLDNIDGLYVYGMDSRLSHTNLSTTTVKGGDIDCRKVTATDRITALSFYESSDARLKNFENKIEIDLDVIKNVPKKYFRWKDKPDKLEIGTSAQEVQKLYPEIVNEDSEGMLSVDYSKLSIIALAAIDKLHEENKELKNRLTKLEELYGRK